MNSAPITDNRSYDDDSKRTKLKLHAPIQPALHEHALHTRCPALAAVESLISRNFFVIDDFVSEAEVAALRREVEQYDKDGRMKEGEIGTASFSAGAGQVKKELRDDVITWLEGSEPWVGPTMRRHILRMDVFSQKISIILDAIKPEMSWEGAGRTKIMASLYRSAAANNGGSNNSSNNNNSGAKYSPHIDNPNKNGRRLTTILYLNPKWKPADGGCLRIKTEKESVEVAPLGGRLICFWPDSRCPHEVMPARAQDRYAITIWYLDKHERREAELRERAKAAAATAAS